MLFEVAFQEFQVLFGEFQVLVKGSSRTHGTGEFVNIIHILLEALKKNLQNMIFI